MKRCVIIYNPHSGRKTKKEFLTQYVDILLKHNYDPEVIFSKYQGHVTKIVKDLSHFDLVITIGGDGTFNEAVNGNLARPEKKRLLMSHIPLGTTNDIGAIFGYGNDPIENLKLLLDGEARNLDICTVNGKAFVYVAGFGKFMTIPYGTPREQKKKLGYLAYLWSGIKEFRHKTKLYDIEFEIDGKASRGLFSFMLISNANRIAGINQFYKEVKLDDGKFEVLFCNLTKKADIIKSLFIIATGDITKVPGFYFYKTDDLKINFNTKVKTWCVDGEKLDKEEYEYHIKTDPNFKVMMPKKNIAINFKEKKD